uniref:Uncharacterized protein n=1 Tax=Periophthalmus magnuspinnatus TaxID=409849 RepID=A0A3B3Z8Y5_9GOBI
YMDQYWASDCLSLSGVGVAAKDWPSAPHGCTDGSCYPATGNLLIGRAVNLSSSSTCGLHYPEQYCIVSHLQESDKCFECDSRSPYNPNNKQSHLIENVIYLMDREGEHTWWQSVNGEENVSIRLNLEAEFHFTHLIIKFKTFRPAAMIIERSADFGRTWRPYRYFAQNCSRIFPLVPSGGLRHINDVICEERYSDIEPSTDGEVIYKVLDPAIHVKDPYSLDIQELLRITNLRLNLTKLNTLGDDLLDRRSDVLQKYYYAIKELVVRGSCFCYGHASECAPVPGVSAREGGMIHGRCVCKHNTEGLNCERCKDFHHDLPWSPAEVEDSHACRECECHGHASSCHFDMAVYLATGNSSGGVCDLCLHNTMGRQCESCRPFYYKDPQRDLRDPQVCQPCDCDPVGSVEGGVCDSHTDLDSGQISGQCRCKVNVRGLRCDDCKEGYYGLSLRDPQGCQPCNCDPRGIVLMGAPCDQISGDCSCKRYVTGRYCNQCLPEFWGLSNDLAGCRPCDCDFGGALNNRCMMDSGHLAPREHLIGRQCSDVQPGFFCAALDHYKYEAEEATGHSPSDPVLPGKLRPQADTDCVQHLSEQLRRHRRHRRLENLQQDRAALRRIRQLRQTPDVRLVHREHSSSLLVTWTGPGFARVKDGAGLVFNVDNIPHAMEYDIMIRYEPESTEDWEAVVSVSSLHLPSSLRCGNLLPTEQLYTVTLPHRSRSEVMPRGFCFEPNNRYVLSIRFQRHGVTYRHLTAFILIDSLVLLPKYTELPGFQGDSPEAELRAEHMQRYMCPDAFLISPTPPLAEMCAKLVCSISALMHNGALPCECDPEGSLSGQCEEVGGQCRCKPNVIGRRCDQCAPGTYGFGVSGCTPCECHPEGSLSHQCSSGSGQCQCRPGASGRRCSDCHPGHWGFPSCSPCQCNGHADLCHTHSGECHACRDHTGGHFCERCEDGFYGNPVLGSGEHCRPCPCPGAPGSDHFNAVSCQADRDGDQIVCNCKPGYTGARCDQCAPGHFGGPSVPGGLCEPCQCNGNIDPLDPTSCDPRTGTCLTCLYHTTGANCAQCQRGYYGNALNHDCRRCTCVSAGTLASACSDGLCECRTETGECPCRGNVIGHSCDQCAPNHWNYGQEGGCQPCSCHPRQSLGPHCNMFSGQCQCSSGFGGRTCEECQELHWGDPQTQCTECQCHPLGSESAQCDRSTGACQCREGAAGPQCDRCARGFSGVFPACASCHACFTLWDDALCQLKRDLEHILLAAEGIVEGGTGPGVNDSRVQELWRRIRQVQALLTGEEAEQVHQLIAQSLDDIRAEMAVLDGRLMSLGSDLNASVSQELSNLNQTLSQKKQLLQDLLTSGFKGTTQEPPNYRRLGLHATTRGSEDQFEKVKRFYSQSLAAEQRCNSSVSGSLSPVEHSQRTRNDTKSILDANRERLQRTISAQNRSLIELQQKTTELEERERSLSQKGGHLRQCALNSTCSDSLCGGAGCRDTKGAAVCGGEGCSGTVSTSKKALSHAHNATRSLNTANNELQEVAKKLQDLNVLTQDVKLQALSALQKAQSKKQHLQTSNQQLKDFIKNIKDFLTEEGADPESIEKVSLQVLSISLPVNRTALDSMVSQIKTSLSNLTNMEELVNRTSNDIGRVRELLQHAQDAKTRAEGVKDAANQTKQALDQSEKAINKATDALWQAVKNLNNTRIVDERLSDLEQRQMDMMLRLMNLSGGVENLRNKTLQNQDMAKEAAALAAQSLNDTERRYEELRKKLDSFGGEGLDMVSERAENLRREAEELLNKANSGVEQLKKLEKKFRNNEQKMQRQRSELEELRGNVTFVRDEIRDQVQKYSNCV